MSKLTEILFIGAVVTSVVTVTINITNKQQDYSDSIQNTMNTAEDMIGWIVEDVANGKVNEETADTYIDNLERVIINLDTLR